MNQFAIEALGYLKENWGHGIANASDAAHLLNINPNTLKTRLARGQASVMREPNGRQVSGLSFTGYHLVCNLLSDRLLRYGLNSEVSDKVYHISNWIFDNILSSPHQSDAMLYVLRDPDGGWKDLITINNNSEVSITDAALIIPIGTMIVRLAGALHLKRTTTPQENLSRLVEVGLRQAD